MSFVSYVPSYPLSKFVNLLWYVNDDLNHTYEKILPHGSIELMFNLGSPFRTHADDTMSEYQTNRHNWISGFQSRYIYLEATAVRSHIIGISFKPEGAFPFFEIPLSEMSGQVIEMDLIWGRWMDEIHEKILDAPDTNSRFQVLEDMLFERLKRDLYGFEAIQFAVSQITRPKETRKISEVTSSIGMSQKHLIGQFRKMIGVSPKQVQKVYRFIDVLNGMTTSHPTDFGRLAVECGYYDQAHFNRDFDAFCGLTPTRYLELRAKYFGTLEPGDGAHFVPLG